MKSNKEKIEDIIVKEVLEDFNIRQHERKSFENTWQLNLNFFMGNQYSFIKPNNNVADYEKQYFWQEKEIFNH